MVSRYDRFMRIRSLAILALSLSAAAANSQQVSWTDWGGGYVRGPDSASTTAATSGAGASKPAAIVVHVVPPNVPMTDWGGGYLRGPDSASMTVATSGAGTPRPSH